MNKAERNSLRIQAQKELARPWMNPPGKDDFAHTACIKLIAALDILDNIDETLTLLENSAREMTINALTEIALISVKAVRHTLEYDP